MTPCPQARLPAPAPVHARPRCTPLHPDITAKAPLRYWLQQDAVEPVLYANHVDTWTAGHQARLAAVRYMAGTATAPTFSGALALRWSERAVICGLARLLGLRRPG